MGITGFGFTLSNGRQLSSFDAEFKEKLPITSEMLDAVDRDDDIAVILSVLATAVMKLEARGVEFDEA